MYVVRVTERKVSDIVLWGFRRGRTPYLLFLKRSTKLTPKTNHTAPAVLEVHNYFPSFVTHYFLANFLKKKKKSSTLVLWLTARSHYCFGKVDLFSQFCKNFTEGSLYNDIIKEHDSESSS